MTSHNSPSKAASAFVNLGNPMTKAQIRQAAKNIKSTREKYSRIGEWYIRKIDR